MAVNKKTALVVDDEPDIVNIVKTMLEGEGYDVLCASDGLEVFGLLADRTSDILIIDRMTPEMNGMELTFRTPKRKSKRISQ